jgi:hypothetical protein
MADQKYKNYIIVRIANHVLKVPVIKIMHPEREIPETAGRYP